MREIHKHTEREKECKRERERPPAYCYQSTAHVLNTPHVKALTPETARENCEDSKNISSLLHIPVHSNAALDI